MSSVQVKPTKPVSVSTSWRSVETTAALLGSAENDWNTVFTADGTLMPAFSMVRGREQVLAHHRLLANLAKQCQHPAVLSQLTLQLPMQHPDFGSKIPCLLLRLDAYGEATAAVLLNEYTIKGLPTGVFVPFDPDGEWNIVAPRGLKSRVAAHAAEFLLRHRRNHIVALTQPGDNDPTLPGFDRHLLPPRLTCGVQRRTILRALPLAATFDQTLALMGAHTRRNLRAARRRVERELGAALVPQAELSETEFLTISRASQYHLDDAVARWRWRQYRSAPGTFLMGLRSADGRWISLLGGRREGPVTRVDWQRNLLEHKALSLSTAMRAFAIEHEIRQGMAELRFEQGTSHSMHNAFVAEPLVDVLVARRLLRPGIFTKVLPHLLPKGSVLASLLAERGFSW